MSMSGLHQHGHAELTRRPWQAPSLSVLVFRATANSTSTGADTVIAGTFQNPTLSPPSPTPPTTPPTPPTPKTPAPTPPPTPAPTPTKEGRFHLRRRGPRRRGHRPRCRNACDQSCAKPPRHPPRGTVPTRHLVITLRPLPSPRASGAHACSRRQPPRRCAPRAPGPAASQVSGL